MSGHSYKARARMTDAAGPIATRYGLLDPTR